MKTTTKYPKRKTGHPKGTRSQFDPSKPRWTTFYRLGVKLNHEMDGVRSWEEVGRLLGISKANAFTLGVLTLGKLAWLARQDLGGAIRNGESF